ncbi:hypothetical protein [Halarcobacter sp.]|uniref:hypothetical protein n=1 Tax=Halarcobacter sp. TaxID=2321133 RepID=UPI0029F4724C|nr:hypothetical protein [Halarcobacter sp.]
MKDIINSFKAHLYERTSSPLIGAFIFYWLIFNYKMIVILFDNKLNSKTKFLEIDNLYKEDIITILNVDVPIQGFLIPSGITLLYILAFPFFSNLIHKAWIWHQNKLKEISNGKVLTKKEFGELQQKFIELELSFDNKFQKKDSEILKLKSFIEKKDTLMLEYQSKIESFEKTIISKDNQIDGLRYDSDNYFNELNHKKEEITQLKQQINNLKPNIDLLEEQVMKLYVPNYKELFSLEEIKERLNINELKTKYIIKQLSGNGYINSVSKQISANRTKFGYILTDKGENFLVENNYIE